MISLANGVADAPVPVANPVASVSRAADALAAAAVALMAAADALRGKETPGAVHSLTPAQGQTLSTNHALDSLTVREVVNEFLVSKARVGRSDRYLRQLRVSLSSFARGRANLAIEAVTLADVEKWLFGQGWKPKTMRGYLADVKTLFHFAERRGFVRTVAPCNVDLPDSPSMAAPGIHSPAEVAAVLECARRVDLDVMRHLAVRYFTGVRSAEAHRMTDANILVDRGFVEVPSEKAKTRRRRLVTIQPALSSWLELGGSLRPMSPDTVKRVRRLSGVNWPANVTRHSFVSYHLAAFESAAKTALEAGHAEQMLFNHYRAVVSQAQAVEFWRIRPA